MSDISLWDDASRNFEEEQAIRRLHAAKSRVGGTWSFLANAQDTLEYEQRKEMAVQALADAVWAVTSDDHEVEETWQRLHASLDEDFAIVLEARKIAHKTGGKHDPVAYTYEADVHCPGCAEERFGRDKHGFIAGEGATDSEGNTPGVLAPWDETDAHGEHCGTCGGQIVEPYTHSPDDCGYSGCTGKVDEHGRVMYHNPRNKSSEDAASGQDALPFEGARHQAVTDTCRKCGKQDAEVRNLLCHECTQKRTAINDAEVSQYSSEVGGNRAAEAAQGHHQNCASCGTHFDGNAGHINFTPGPNGAEWNHCPGCGESAQYGAVQDCGPNCQKDHNYEPDDHDDYRDDAPDYHGLDGDNYGDPYGKMDAYHDFRQSSKQPTLNVLAVVRVTAGEEAGKFIIVDEDSGYKVGGPFASRSEAEQAIASGKYRGKNVKIEKAGEEEAKEEDAHKGGKGSHDESGGSKPFDSKGHPRKKGSGGRHPFV